MRILIDVNFGASWVEGLRKFGIDSTYWADVGRPAADDDELVEWSHQNHHVLLTQDLGIARRLKLSGASGPSVLQVRHVDDLTRASLDDVVRAAKSHESALDAGAIVTLDARTGATRVRRLS